MPHSLVIATPLGEKLNNNIAISVIMIIVVIVNINCKVLTLRAMATKNLTARFINHRNAFNYVAINDGPMFEGGNGNASDTYMSDAAIPKWIKVKDRLEPVIKEVKHDFKILRGYQMEQLQVHFDDKIVKENTKKIELLSEQIVTKLKAIKTISKQLTDQSNSGQDVKNYVNYNNKIVMDMLLEFRNMKDKYNKEFHHYNPEPTSDITDEHTYPYIDPYNSLPTINNPVKGNTRGISKGVTRANPFDVESTNMSTGESDGGSLSGVTQYEPLKYSNTYINQRNTQILNVVKQVNEISEMMVEMNEIIHMQDDTIDNIAIHIEKAKNDVDRGNQELVVAKKSNNSKCKNWIIIILIIIMIICSIIIASK